MKTLGDVWKHLKTTWGRKIKIMTAQGNHDLELLHKSKNTQRIGKMNLEALALGGPSGDRMDSGIKRGGTYKIAARDEIDKRGFFVTLAFGHSMFGGMGGQNMACNKRALHE